MPNLFDLDDDLQPPQLESLQRRPRRLAACLVVFALTVAAAAGGAAWAHFRQGTPTALKPAQALRYSIYGAAGAVAEGPVSKAEVVEVDYNRTPPRWLPQAKPLTFPVPAVLQAEPAAEIPGALPAAFTYQYNDDYHGWPVKPLHQAHTVRGGFLDPRGLAGGYHFGVDISVDDMHKEPGAPYGATHQVYAVESGYVAESNDGSGLTGPCSDDHFALGHFEYWHIHRTVQVGQYVKAGQPIGWTCFGEWHIHLSEWQLVNGVRTWVNPLEGGKLTPYSDSAKPTIGKFSFYTPTSQVWCPTRTLAEADGSDKESRFSLNGQVELRVAAADHASLPKRSFMTSRLQAVTSPYRVAVVVRNASDRSIVFADNSFEADSLPSTPYLIHYAPGSTQNLPVMVCYRHPNDQCAGSYLLRPFSDSAQRYWDTRQVANGAYLITVYAWDIKQNMAQRTEKVIVDNPEGDSALAGNPVATSSIPACWQNGYYRAWAAGQSSLPASAD